MIAETQRRYGSSYREDVRLPDGTVLTVRALGPDDATLLQRHFEHLSFESRHLRFLGGKSALTESELRFYTHPDGEMHVALIAVRADSPQKAVGVARFVRSKDTPQVAERACAVIDSMQAHGVGKVLITRLFQAALERGVRSFRWDMQADNGGILRMLEELSPGFRARRTNSTMVVDVAFSTMMVDVALEKRATS